MLTLLIEEAPQTRGRKFPFRALHPHLEALTDQARRAEDSSRLLFELLAEGPACTRAADGIVRLDAEAHDFNMELTTRLSASFITPLDPEDVQAVSTGLTRVVQAMRRAADVAREVPSRKRWAPAQQQLSVMVSLLGEALRTLAEGQPAFEQAAAVLKSHREVRNVMRGVAAALVRDQGDVLHLLAEQRLCSSLDDVLYRVRKTTTCLQGLILKNS